MSQPPAARQDFESWFNLTPLGRRYDNSAALISTYKQCLNHGRGVLKQHFDSGFNTHTLLQGRSWLVDQVLVHAWELYLGDAAETLALAAVGGYGRSELMPGSDIDLLVLLPENAGNRYDAPLTALLTFLWDIGLEVGHSVRTVAECVTQAVADITVITNLMEARWLTGSMELFFAMQDATAPDRIWSSRDFFIAKREEQRIRNLKYNDTAYNLEPNIKEGPGGLRDIQTIAWVASRHFGTDSLEELVERGFLTQQEYQTLTERRAFLWKIRFALHMLTGRGEDRLLFDYQRTLADQLGYRNDEIRLGVEAFMKDYYRTVMSLGRLNEMLMQLFHEDIRFPDGPGEPVLINKRFQSRHGFLEIAWPTVFRYYPHALLEVFLILEQHPELKGVRADTIRSIRAHLHLIDDTFRRDIRARSLFMEILRQPRGVTRALHRMNNYGVLAAYLPAFGQIVGQMQYDLFHIYTVDEHILTVIRNLRRFTVQDFALEFPLCSHVVATLPKPELLYLAGLFHDIAKGRGGDHSELGGRDARDFCLQHDLSEYDAGLVTWLVENHLVMSATAQSQDISDPAVVNRFARRFRDPVHLDYLYLLTVADIRATNPELWNSWKDALLKQLYYSTRRALQRGLEDPMERSEHIQKIQEAALELLTLERSEVEDLWQRLGDEYFLRHIPWQVAHHTTLLRARATQQDSLVDIQPLTERGGTEIFIYAPAADDLFSRITAVLDQVGLNVVDAGIITTDDGHGLHTYHVLEVSGAPITGMRRSEEIRSALQTELEHGRPDIWHVARRMPRMYRHFPIKTHVDFKPDELDRRTIMSLITSDRPGLLSRVGRAFLDCRVRLQNAKIATMGARAEDVFYITDFDNQPLREDAQFECLERSIHKYLDDPRPEERTVYRI
jgi:[protein-PII] uridylyltransferase